MVVHTDPWHFPPVRFFSAVVCELQKDGEDEVDVERPNEEPEGPPEPAVCDTGPEKGDGECRLAPGLAHHGEHGGYGDENEHPVIPRLDDIACSELDADEDASHDQDQLSWLSASRSEAGCREGAHPRSDEDVIIPPETMSPVCLAPQTQP